MHVCAATLYARPVAAGRRTMHCCACAHCLIKAATSMHYVWRIGTTHVCTLPSCIDAFYALLNAALQLDASSPVVVAVTGGVTRGERSDRPSLCVPAVAGLATHATWSLTLPWRGGGCSSWPGVHDAVCRAVSLAARVGTVRSYAGSTGSTKAGSRPAGVLCTTRGLRAHQETRDQQAGSACAGQVSCMFAVVVCTSASCRSITAGQRPSVVYGNASYVMLRSVLASQAACIPAGQTPSPSATVPRRPVYLLVQTLRIKGL